MLGGTSRHGAHHCDDADDMDAWEAIEAMRVSDERMWKSMAQSLRGE